MSEQGGPIGLIRGIAHRSVKGEALREAETCRVLVGRGLEKEGRPPGKRCVTLLSEASWADACRELGVELPWITRRANFLVSGLDLSTLVGRPIMIGEVRVWIHSETKPCKLMDEQHAGLRAALGPEFRGGVYGQTLTEGTIRLGDRVVFTEARPAPLAVQ